MRFLPCRVCGEPVTGGTGEGIKSFCCSRSKCMKEDTGVNTDEPTIVLTEKKWKSRINLLTRGY